MIEDRSVRLNSSSGETDEIDREILSVGFAIRMPILYPLFWID
jgi:hypothetical protein